MRLECLQLGVGSTGGRNGEHFGEPDKLSGRITEATCEACNSYNMMKLTRHLYGWQPDARWFDYYERVQLNHIMAHQNPQTGRFVYFMPLAAGARRTYSSAEDSFWCCVGSGLESHAKHADSIFWHEPTTLYVNLFIPSTLDLPERNLALDLDTGMPTVGEASLTIRRAPARAMALAIRIPGWAKNATVALNGSRTTATMRNGYAVVDRRWRTGDRLSVVLPMAVEAEPTPGAPDVVAFVRGPLVLAADLGPASESFDGVGPALVTASATNSVSPGGGIATYRAEGAMGESLLLTPFFSQYHRRAAVYFPTFTPAAWVAVRSDYVAAAGEARTLARRTVDTVYLGEMQPERDHGFVAGKSDVVNWAGRSARRLHIGDSVEMRLARRPGAAILRVLVAKTDDGKTIEAGVDGITLRNPVRVLLPGGNHAALDFPVPAVGTQGNAQATVSFTARGGEAVLYEVRMLAEPASVTADNVTDCTSHSDSSSGRPAIHFA